MVSSRGGIGIRARLRILCPLGRTGSSPVDCMIKLLNFQGFYFLCCIYHIQHKMMKLIRQSVKQQKMFMIIHSLLKESRKDI